MRLVFHAGLFSIFDKPIPDGTQLLTRLANRDENVNNECEAENSHLNLNADFYTREDFLQVRFFCSSVILFLPDEQTCYYSLLSTSQGKRSDG